jgi:hypothetical protein
MTEVRTTSTGCGCGSLIVGILLVWALWFGLPTPWGTFNIDIFPPAIRQVD